MSGSESGSEWGEEIYAEAWKKWKRRLGKYQPKPIDKDRVTERSK